MKNDDVDYQELSDLAYKEVLRDLRLAPGTRLHEDADRVECWQKYFALFRALAEDPLLREGAESGETMLQEAAE
jgi:hypothetical protein